ncbi:MAG: hypothetical protein JXR26_01875 [Balneolaceae bacterium]|nr:hypothetical protein [Balneolaceae bacterium]
MGEDAIIVAIVFGSILGMIAIPMFINLAKKWIDRNSTSFDDEKFERLAKAFIQHKKETERRLQNIEAIVTDDEPKSTSTSSSKSSPGELKKTQLHNQIEIDSNESEETKKNQKESDGGNLRNMLKE